MNESQIYRKGVMSYVFAVLVHVMIVLYVLLSWVGRASLTLCLWVNSLLLKCLEKEISWSCRAPGCFPNGPDSEDE